jgi:hypothetical protein
MTEVPNVQFLEVPAEPVPPDEQRPEQLYREPLPPAEQQLERALSVDNADFERAVHILNLCELPPIYQTIRTCLER